MERGAPIPGGDLPGVMTIGAGQTLVRRYGVVPGARVLIAGHGPLGLQLAAETVRAGGHVAAMADRGRPGSAAALAGASRAAPRLVLNGARYMLTLRAARVPVLHGWEIDSIVADGQARDVVLRRLRDGARRRFTVDAVCAADGFAPQCELARLLGVTMDIDRSTGIVSPRRDDHGATGVANLWIAGDGGGLGGAQIAAAQGALAAAAVVRDCCGHDEPDTTAARAALRRAQRFQTALWSLYAAPPRALPTEDATLICRCESVSVGQVRQAIAAGASDPGALKRATRLGMGRCQGRFCMATAHRLLAAADHPCPPEALFAPQPPARPLPLAALAHEKPEWGGHRESRPAARPALHVTTPLARTKADLVIIGGGVTGLSAALFAARSGADVVCLERGRLGAEASGGNAGSLHLQLLSWDFGAKAMAGGTPALHTLPLQAESIALWSQLEEDLDADFEMAVTGGLMVAENPAQIVFLQAKARSEASMGITTDVIGPDRLRAIVPALSDRFVAGAWCPGEGKINPLAANVALAAAARAAGARLEEMCPVTGIAPDGDGYAITTVRGTVNARRVLIAAGGWSAQLGAMLGCRLPIRGAPLQMIVTEPAPPLIPCLIAHADRHLTMKQVATGGILIGGAWTGRTGPAGQAEVLAESMEGNAWVAARTVPALGHVNAIRTWAAMNIDIDGAPLIDTLPGHPGVTVSATANGYTLGPLIGREAAALALTGRLRQDMTRFTLARFD